MKSAKLVLVKRDGLTSRIGLKFDTGLVLMTKDLVWAKKQDRVNEWSLMAELINTLKAAGIEVDTQAISDL